MTKRRRGQREPSGPSPSPFGDPNPRGGMLASQVDEALRLALATLDDPRLEDATVRDVTAEGGALRATIECEALDVPAVIAALDRAMPRIRFELASDIHRKKLPSVRFVVLPRGAPA